MYFYRRLNTDLDWTPAKIAGVLNIPPDSNFSISVIPSENKIVFRMKDYSLHCEDGQCCWHNPENWKEILPVGKFLAGEMTFGIKDGELPGSFPAHDVWHHSGYLPLQEEL